MPPGPSPDATALPVSPPRRSRGCPLAPPVQFARWRESKGLQLAMWRDEPTWIVSRYADIRAALVDPRLSANTMSFDLSDTSAPVIFARVDDPEHNRLRRMMTRD